MRENVAEFYEEREIFTPTFEKKDYFWPVKTETLVKNVHLLQSPYWGGIGSE
jgi:hypothetical protein